MATPTPAPTKITYTPTTNANPTYGQSGDTVKAYQTQLNTQNAGKAGYVPLKVDGLYGPLTQAASSFGKTTSPAVGDAINGNQDSDINSGNDAVPTRDSRLNSSDPTDVYKGLSDLITNGTTAPAVPSLTQNYNDLSSQYHLDNLNSQLTDLTNQENQVQDQLSVNQNAENDKPVAMNVIEGRQSEEARQANEQLTQIDRQKSYVSSQIQAANSAIDTIMKYTQQDYENSKDSYHQQISDNLSILSASENFMDDKQKLASANAQVIMNSLVGSGITDATKLPAELQAQLSTLGVQSGLGANFYSDVLKYSTKPILTTITSADKTQATIIYKDGTRKVIGTGLPASGTTATADTYKLSADDKKSLISSGLTSPEINSVQGDIAKYGLSAVLANPTLDKKTKAALESIFGQ